jgi:ADP-heptose:LPS heptosyltransferase
MAGHTVSSIVISPFSNSDIRDWPASHYGALISELVRRTDQALPIRVVGTRNQFTRACDIVRDFDPARVINDCGRLSWDELVAELRAAACMIGNNSGLAHLAGSFGVPTVCVFGGSHQRTEWRPLGRTVITISRVIACSPCGLDHGESCKFDKACLRQIEPGTVAGAVLSAMRRFSPAAGHMPDDHLVPLELGV